MGNRAARRREKAMQRTVRSFDGFAPLRDGLRAIARSRGDWAGIPMPLDGLPLVIEPKFPNAAGLMEIGRKPEDEEDLVGIVQRNEWWSRRLRGHVVIWTEKGKLCWGVVPAGNHLKMDMEAILASAAWGLEQEQNALKLLGTLISHQQFKKYLLTGMFLETSPRSGVGYLFRKLKPTIALRSNDDGPTRILAALCLHPIAHYAGTWAGGMCPTDDVVAHLMLMRGDEHMFWRRANQHAPDRVEAGI